MGDVFRFLLGLVLEDLSFEVEGYKPGLLERSLLLAAYL